MTLKDELQQNSMNSCPCHVEVLDTKSGDLFRAPGVYSSDGSLACTLKLSSSSTVPLVFDPEQMWEDDPKRLFNLITMKWTQYRIRSIVLNSNYIKREAKNGTS